jgi:hypothetical protein
MLPLHCLAHGEIGHCNQASTVKLQPDCQQVIGHTFRISAGTRVLALHNHAERIIVQVDTISSTREQLLLLQDDSLKGCVLYVKEVHPECKCYAEHNCPAPQHQGHTALEHHRVIMLQHAGATDEA